MKRILLVLGLTLWGAPAAAGDSLDEQPDKLEHLGLSWYDADGTPRTFQEIEGWLLKDPASARYVRKRATYKRIGTVLTGLGGTALAVGAGLAIRDISENGDGSGGNGDGLQFTSFIPAISGVVLIAVGIPLVTTAKKFEKRAVEVYGGVTPLAGGAAVGVGGSF